MSYKAVILSPEQQSGELVFDGVKYTVKDSISFYHVWDVRDGEVVGDEYDLNEVEDNNQDFYYYEVDGDNWSSIEAFIAYKTHEETRNHSFVIGHKVWQVVGKNLMGYREVSEERIALYICEDDCHTGDCDHDKAGDTCSVVSVEVYDPEHKSIYIVR